MFHGTFDREVSGQNDDGFDKVEDYNTDVKVSLKLQPDVQPCYRHQCPEHDEFHDFLDFQLFVSEAELL